jgi:putative FmdB family regulatory protein
MPMYEYRCEGCKETFTVMQRMGAGTDGLKCPACGKKKISKLISAPTVIDPDRGLPSESTMRNAMSQMQQAQASSPCASGACGAGNSCTVKEFGGD